MGRRELWQFIRALLLRSGRDRVTTSAASLALHEFLALVPGAIALVGVANLIGLPHNRLRSLLHGIAVLLPTSAAKLFQQALTTPNTRSSDVVAVVLGGTIALWASVEAAVALEIGLDMAYETRTDRGFVARRVRGLGLVGVTLLFGGGAFLLLIIGSPLGSLVPHFGGTAFSPLWTSLRWVVGIALVVLLIFTYELFGPNRVDRRWIRLSVGGSVSTVLWLAVAASYSFYLNHFGHSAETYGAFAGVVTLLIWLYLSAVVILLGAELNRELEARSDSGDRRSGRGVRTRHSRSVDRAVRP